MESYREATYRYSTGQGFNLNVDVPKIADDVAAYKMEPLYANLIRPSFNVNLKREADRVSMQVEDAARQFKLLGYDSEGGKRFRDLKSRLDVIKYLMVKHAVEYIKKSDLENIYTLYKNKDPQLDKKIKVIIYLTN